jgi:RNA polymerase sigma-70 factor (ECF subfamily)
MYSQWYASRFVSLTGSIMNTSLKDFSDQQLIDQFKQGHKQAFGELYNRYYKVVYNRCLQLCKDEDVAFDLTQEVSLKAYDHVKDFRGESLFKTWIYTIASRHCYTYLQRQKPGLSVDEQLADVLPEESEEDQQSVMLALIYRLPQEERSLLLSKYEKGTSIEELEHELNLSASAIKMRLKRSREKLNVVYALAMSFGLDYALNMLEVM